MKALAAAYDYLNFRNAQHTLLRSKALARCKESSSR